MTAFTPIATGIRAVELRQPKPKPGGPQGNPIRTAQLLNFYGYHNDVMAHSFQAMCGLQPPTITGGWANVANIVRPRSIDYTMITDYPPFSMDVQLRFDRWVNWRHTINGDLEGDLSRLMWMANRGTLGPGSPHEGNPPIIRVGAYNHSGEEIPLIPAEVQGLDWIITNLAYDTSPLRFSAEDIAQRGLKDVQIGERARQDVTVSLTQWVPAPGFHNPVRKPANGNIARQVFPRYNSIARMCAHYFGRTSQDDWRAVMQLPANAHLQLRSARQELLPGTKIWFPSTFEKQRRGGP